jgi:predicted ATPase
MGGLTAYTEQGNKLYVPFLQGLLSELEAENQNQAGALIQIEEALTIANRTGEHWADSFLYRIHGETLLKGEPANTAPAEEAFLAAIAIAKQQKAKSFELRAALSLAKLYQSTGRPAEAQAVRARGRWLFANAGVFRTRRSANIACHPAIMIRSEERRLPNWGQSHYVRAKFGDVPR